MSTAMTPQGVLLYPSLDKTAVFDGDDTGKYQITVLFPPDADLSALDALIDAAIQKKWGGKPPSNLRHPIRPVEELKKLDHEKFAGWRFARFKTKDKVGIVAADAVTRIDTADPDGVYSGCIGRVSCGAYGYKAGSNLGVSFFLRHVQKIRDGERIGPSSSPESDFEPLAAPSENDPLSFI